MNEIIQNFTYNMTIVYIAAAVLLILLGVVYIAHRVSKEPPPQPQS